MCSIEFGAHADNGVARAELLIKLLLFDGGGLGCRSHPNLGRLQVGRKALTIC
ncbi:hypothetical protein PPGU19_081130 (plasmid) [Paraburkholderia sp. PGU19]|nr:hypothetical protein PPGU19_081130 [Paraburkholderia sp. PGU19]